MHRNFSARLVMLVLLCAGTAPAQAPASSNARRLQGRTVCANAPADAQALAWDAQRKCWAPANSLRAGDLSAARWTGSSAYQQTASLVPAGAYVAPVAGTGNWRGGATSIEAIVLGQRYRIRQTGLVRQAKVFIYDLGGHPIVGFYLKFWRPNGSTFDLVGTTANLASQLVAGQINTLAFAAPIAVQEGDYYGYRAESSGGTPNYTFYALTVQSDVATRYEQGTATWTSGLDPGAKTLSNYTAVPIHFLMYAPAIVMIGDSITAGHPANYSFAETTGATTIVSDFTSDYPRALGQMLAWPVQNLGRGSQTCADLAARFDADVVQLKPRLAIVQCGINDLAGAVPQATTLAHIASMLAAAQTAGFQSVVALVAPWTAGSNAQLQARDALNAAILALAPSYGAITVNFDAALGQNRPAGDAGNLWNIRTEFNQDNVHFNAAGYNAYAAAILQAILSTAPPMSASSIRSANGFQDTSTEPCPVCDAALRGRSCIEKGTGAAGADQVKFCLQTNATGPVFAWVLK